MRLGISGVGVPNPTYKEIFKMRRKKSYIFTKKSHSNKAIFSTILGSISLISQIIVIYLAYLQAESGERGYGAAGLLMTLFAFAGLILGIIAAGEKERYKLFIVLGIVLNILALLGMGIILYAGVYYL